MTEYTLCEDTGQLGQAGGCPTHGGDACLRQFVPAGDVVDLLLAMLRESTDDGRRVGFDAVLAEFGWTREGLAMLHDNEEQT